LMAFWLQGVRVDSPLLRYLQKEFHPAFHSRPNDIQIWVRWDRQEFIETNADGSAAKVVPLSR
jgi:hypothetical protein